MIQNRLIQCCVNNTVNLRHSTPRVISCLYPQNGDSIVVIDSVTSLSPRVGYTATSGLDGNVQMTSHAAAGARHSAGAIVRIPQ